jgi:hypothetical protein
MPNLTQNRASLKPSRACKDLYEELDNDYTDRQWQLPGDELGCLDGTNHRNCNEDGWELIPAILIKQPHRTKALGVFVLCIGKQTGMILNLMKMSARRYAVQCSIRTSHNIWHVQCLLTNLLKTLLAQQVWS